MSKPDGEFRNRAGGEFLKPVFEILVSKLEGKVVDPRMQEIQTLFPIVEAMLKHVQVNEKSNSENPDLFGEKLIATCGIAKLWKDSSDIQDKKRALLSLRDLWDDERDRPFLFEESETYFYGIEHNILADVLKHYFPESGGEVNWFHTSGLVTDHVVEIPVSREELHKLLLSLYANRGIGPRDSRFNLFVGGSNLKERLVFVPRDVKENYREHERNHVKYPGLRWGLLGGSVNEGLTEYLAQEKVGGKTKRFPWLFGSYWSEVHFLRKLFAEEPELATIMIARYKTLNVDTSVALIVGLVNRIGVEGVFQMMRARPFLGRDKTSRQIISKSEQLPTSSLYDTFGL